MSGENENRGSSNGAAEFYLVSSQKIGPFPDPPEGQLIAEVLGKIPFNGFSGGEIKFNWGLVDRPEAGSALLVFLTPPARPPPPDGLRYASEETSVITHHNVNCATIQNPMHASPTTVELECLTIIYGHHPPISTSFPLSLDSPERTLTRYRKRYRLARGGGNPGLNLIYWGQNENGGGPIPKLAPSGWEVNPGRAYPLTKNIPTTTVSIFGGQNRSAPGSSGDNKSSNGASRPTSSSGPSFPSIAAGSFQPFSQKQRMAQGSNGQQYNHQVHAQAQAQALATVQNSIYTQNGALTNQGIGGTDPRLRLADHHPSNGPQMNHPQHSQSQGPLPSGLTQQQQHHLLLQQQQQQQQSILQQQALAKQANSRRSKGQFQQDPRLAAQHQQQLQQQQQQQQHRQDSGQLAHEGHLPGDILDVLTTRQMAITRFAQHHDVMESIFDPWSVTQILGGEKQPLISSEELMSKKSRKEGWENWLELSSGGDNAEGKYGPEIGKRLDLEERRQRLQKRLEKMEQENEEQIVIFEEKRRELIALGL